MAESPQQSFKSIAAGEVKFTKTSAEAVVATFGVKDSDGDVLLPGAIGTQVVPVIPGHNWQHIPVGKATVSERGTKLIARIQFNPTAAAREWQAALKFDLANPPVTQQWSWGYRTVKSHRGTLAGEQVNFLEKVELFEVSPVIRGASVGTMTVHFSDDDKAELRAIAAKLARDERKERLAFEIAFLEGAVKFAEFERRQAIAETNERLADFDGHHIRTVPESSVDQARVRLAKTVAEFTARDRGVAPPEFQWFTQPGGRQNITLFGRVLKNITPPVVQLNARQAEWELLKTVVHEIGHLAGDDECAARTRELQFARSMGVAA